MNITTIFFKQTLILILLSTITFNQAIAKSDIENIGNVQASPEKHEGHSKDLKKITNSQKYHGVYYGLLPCKDCDGIKTTLSLKNRNNYLIVTQDAKASAREYFEKGKYIWDDETQIVTLTSRKNSTIRKYKIKNETLIQISSDGSPLNTTQKKTSYVLHKNKRVEQSTSLHMH